MNYARRKKETPVAIHLIRIVLALVFILSGFLKGVDPWGTAIKTGEYLAAFHLEQFSGAAYALAVGQCAFELWIGLLLLFNRMRTFGRFFAMLFMAVFTVLTLVIALTDPVSDCGCFGDAIQLTNWETFIKNAILLPLSVILFAHTRREVFAETASCRGMSLILLGLALFPPLTAVNGLPWIDFLPYRVGTNLPAQMYVAPEDRGESRTTLLYRNLETEEVAEFEVTDTTWYDSTLWEFVDTRTAVISAGKEPAIGNFVIFGRTDDVTDRILSEKEIFVLTADRLEEVDARQADRFARIARFARKKGIPVVCLTTSPLESEAGFRARIGEQVPCYNIDATTLKTMIRARYGLIILENGTIIAKKNLRQAPDFEAAGVQSGLEYVMGRRQAENERNFIVIYTLLILGLLFVRYRVCRN